MHGYRLLEFTPRTIRKGDANHLNVSRKCETRPAPRRNLSEIAMQEEYTSVAIRPATINVDAALRHKKAARSPRINAVCCKVGGQMARTGGA
jgi:hypothetical protein